MNQDAQGQKMAQIIAKCWSDSTFKAKLLADPVAVLQAEGLPVPAGMRLEVVEDTPQRVHWVLPARPTDLSDDALEQVAGGNASWYDDHMQQINLLTAPNIGALLGPLFSATKPEFRQKVLEIFTQLSKKY